MADNGSCHLDQILLLIFQKIEELSQFKDVDSILDKILYESRKLTKAEAGSIFLIKDGELEFSYVQNDKLFLQDQSSIALYENFTIPISEKSIVGYAALIGQTIVIDDAYKLPDNLPYSFNPSKDKESGYRTSSMLTIPLKTLEGKLVGVMQLINARNAKNLIGPFSEASQVYMPIFANNASIAIERGIMNRELILRMMKMAELRDPKETGAHVQRVGAYSAEIYQQWARSKKLDTKTLKKFRDKIRLAAMLHDVGKVGIPDAILKKPAKLNDEEFNTMKWHTVFGARLFLNKTSSLDEMSQEIALGHHEKWAGNGYPGKISSLMTDTAQMGQPKQGEEIPIAARITALADVYDALSSKRSYKDAWRESDVLDTIEKDSGTHFDPDVVEAFFQVLDKVKAIANKYQEK